MLPKDFEGVDAFLKYILPDDYAGFVEYLKDKAGEGEESEEVE